MTMAEGSIAFKHIAYCQNAPGLEPARMADEEMELGPLPPDDAEKCMTKWEMYDALFKNLKEDTLMLYSQFEVREDTIDAMLWPADSYAKTQIYKLNHFLMLYHEGRCRELVDIVKGLISLLRAICEEQWGEPMDVEVEALD